MRLHIPYSLTFLSGLPDGFQVPLRIEREGMVFELLEIDESGKQGSAYIEGPVNPHNLQIRTGRKPLDGGEPYRGIEVPEQAAFSRFLSVIVNTISFLTDVPIRYSHKLSSDRLIAESEDDIDLLRSFGTEKIHQSLQATVGIRTFSLARVSQNALEALLRKDIGLALYSQALIMQESTAKFCEFWKVLESAFGTKNDELIKRLTEYEPAIQLGFTHDELKGLLVLRGRASHAKSRSGIDELRYVIAETSRRNPRLKCLVEQVLVTKKTWGSPTLETERIARIAGFIASNGHVVLVKPSEASGDDREN